uniref:Sema domain-containing protein n=1 Tax=Macrostomum lignano TaxID=282301 RepID=A0A1I8IZA6_9PLAT
CGSWHRLGTVRCDRFDTPNNLGSDAESVGPCGARQLVTWPTRPGLLSCPTRVQKEGDVIWPHIRSVTLGGVLNGKAGCTRRSRDQGPHECFPKFYLAMSWASYFPEQLTEKPVGLVALTGLDVERNPATKPSWTRSASTGSPTDFLCASSAMPLITRHSEVRLAPQAPGPGALLVRGVLRLRLGRSAIPREANRMAPGSVRVVRECLAGRLTSVAVVLLQRKPALPLEEDLSAKEKRAPSLCSACDLNPNHLFVLVQTEHLYGYIIRLESAFFDLSQNYYHQEARRGESHRPSCCPLPN